jgi:hypothetical protein
MSEYQYYEFQTVERLLNSQEQKEISKLSSRVQLTPKSAIFVYNYGDFRGEPKEVLSKYFDVMFYIANWGTWQLMFKFPQKLVSKKWFEPYLINHAITITETSEYLILDLTIDQDESIMGWVEGEGWLSRLLPLRDNLLAGDVRLLYLTWLKVAPHLVEYELPEDPIEPPIPANLGQLSQPLKAFIELVELEPDLVEAAQQESCLQPSNSNPHLENWLSALSEAEKQEFLLKLVRREPHVDLQLINRLKELAGISQNFSPSTPGSRRLSQLEEIAEAIHRKREEKERIEAKKKRIKQLEALATKESQTWDRVVELIEIKQAKTYDEATALLKDLRDLAEYQGKLSEFSQRFNQLKSDYRNRSALIKRFAKI